MPSESTIQQIKIRNVIGDKTDLPKVNTRASLNSKQKALLFTTKNIPQLIHMFGALEPNKTLTLSPGEDLVNDIFVDGTYMYVALNISPAKIIKIDLDSFIEVASITLNAGENRISALASDGIYLYAGLFVSPGKVVRIDLKSFTRVDSVTTSCPGEIMCLYVDGTSIYAGSDDSPAVISQIDLDTFTENTILTLDANEDDVRTIKSDGNFLYAGCNTSPGIIVKIETNEFTRVSALTLDTGEDKVFSIFIDGIYLYACCYVSPGKVVKIDIYSLTKIATTTFLAGNEYVNSLFSDGTFIYAGLFMGPGTIQKIDIASFTYAGEYNFDIVLGENNVNTIFIDGTYLYAGLYTIPGKIVRRYIIPTDTSHKRGDYLLNEQMHSGIYNIYPENSTGVSIQSAAGAYTKGAYVEVIPVNTIKTMIFITGMLIQHMTADIDYVFDIAIGASDSIIATDSTMTDNAHKCGNLLFNPPIKVPSNTKVSIRSSDDTGAQSSIVKIRYKL